MGALGGEALRPGPRVLGRGRLIEHTAELSHQSVTAFAIDALVARVKRARRGTDVGLLVPPSPDRLLVAQALTEGLPLLSADGKFHVYASLGLRLVG